MLNKWWKVKLMNMDSPVWIFVTRIDDTYLGGWWGMVVYRDSFSIQPGNEAGLWDFDNIKSMTQV
jgi:hypothetical protein